MLADDLVDARGRQADSLGYLAQRESGVVGGLHHAPAVFVGATDLFVGIGKQVKPRHQCHPILTLTILRPHLTAAVQDGVQMSRRLP